MLLCTLLTPFVEELLEHVHSELDGDNVPGLHWLHTGHVLLLLTPEGGAAEQVTLGTSIQQRLKQGAMLTNCSAETAVSITTLCWHCLWDPCDLWRLCVAFNCERKTSIEIETVFNVIVSLWLPNFTKINSHIFEYLVIMLGHSENYYNFHFNDPSFYNLQFMKYCDPKFWMLIFTIKTITDHLQIF